MLVATASVSESIGAKMKNLKNGQYVDFDNGFMTGSGWVRGVASVEQPVIGRGMIIELDGALWDYDAQIELVHEWSCQVIFEVHINA